MWGVQVNKTISAHLLCRDELRLLINYLPLVKAAHIHTCVRMETERYLENGNATHFWMAVVQNK